MTTYGWIASIGGFLVVMLIAAYLLWVTREDHLGE
jgi:hypothetical protein